MNSLVSAGAEMSPCLDTVGRLLTPKLRERTALDATRLWAELVAGRLTIARHGVDPGEAWLELRPQSSRAARGFTDAQALLTERILCGLPQKCVCLELGMSPSFVSGSCSHVLRKFGAPCSARATPMALAMLAVVHDSGGALSLPAYRLQRGIEPEYVEVRMGRPESALRKYLTKSEYETLNAFLAGHTHSGVGALRGRSPRTIANQLHSVTSKLQVYGRLPLIRAAVVMSNGNAPADSIPSESARLRTSATADKLS